MQAGRHMLPVLLILTLSTLHAGASTAPAEVQPKAASADYLSAAGKASLQAHMPHSAILSQAVVCHAHD